MFKRILVPLDGSELSEWALQPAVRLARAAGGEIILLQSLIPIDVTVPTITNEYIRMWPEYSREQMRTNIREYLVSVQQKYHKPGVRWQILDVEGDAAGEIVDTATAENADLIVMSTHGWSGVRKWALGSVTERVLHNVTCPVLAVRSPQTIKRLAVTLDGSQLAEQVVRPALALAAGLSARVTLLRVNEPLPAGGVLGAHGPAIEFDWTITGKDRKYGMVQQRQAQSELYLEEIARRYARDDVVVHSIVVDGPPVDKILECADLHGIDLIAMSTHGRTGLRRWLYGSVTAKVMRGFEGHMLIVRPPAHELK